MGPKICIWVDSCKKMVQKVVQVEFKPVLTVKTCDKCGKIEVNM